MKEIQLKISIDYFILRVPLIGFSSSKKHSATLIFDLSAFPEIDSRDIKVKPWNYNLLTIATNEILTILKSLKNKIKFKYDVISKVTIEANYGNKELLIFCRETNSPINKTLIDNKTGSSTEEILHFYRTRDSWRLNPEVLNESSELNLSFIDEYCIHRTYIGFLGLSPQELKNGKEIKVQINLNNRIMESYIFLKEVYVIRIKQNLHYYDFFVYNYKTSDEIKEQCQMLLEYYPTAISCHTITNLYSFNAQNFDFAGKVELNLPDTFNKSPWRFTFNLDTKEITYSILDKPQNNYSDIVPVEDYKKQLDLLKERNKEYWREWWWYKNNS